MTGVSYWGHKDALMTEPVFASVGPFSYVPKFRNFVGFVNGSFGLNIDPSKNLYVYLEERTSVHPRLEFTLIPEARPVRVETHDGHVFMVQRSDHRDRRASDSGLLCVIS